MEYGELEGAEYGMADAAGSPMLGGGGGRGRGIGTTMTMVVLGKRKWLIFGLLVAGVMVAMGAAARDAAWRIQPDWRFERWRGPEVGKDWPTTGANGSIVRMEDGEEFVYRNEL
jgi:hypothetical protein